MLQEFLKWGLHLPSFELHYSAADTSATALASHHSQVNIWKGSFFHHFYSRAYAACYSLLLVVQGKILVIFFTFFSLDSNQQSY